MDPLMLTLLAEGATESVLAFALVVHGRVVDRDTTTLLAQEKGQLVAAGVQVFGQLVQLVRIVRTDGPVVQV